MILSEFIYGGMDGVITTVAIIAGIMGANIAPKYALVLGLASLFADGFSMGISRYNSIVDIEKTNISPFVSGLATFISFVLIGSIPLLPFMFIPLQKEEFIQKWMIISSVIALLLIGVIKGIYTHSLLKSTTEVLLIGIVGVFVSFHVARFVRSSIE
tara:strand:- start:70 stop:540 length:471 start_codon:yes stop_codon:yes gene_type:complete